MHKMNYVFCTKKLFIFHSIDFWIALLGGLAVAAGVVVFHYPKLELPDTKEFQLFSSSHPFER